MIRYGLSFLLMLNAAGFAWQRAQQPEYIGIDFVQFHFTGQHVVTGGDSHVYADDVRAEILDSAWQQVLTEGIESRCSYAVDFRHQRSWETYSSPFLYAVFGVMAGRESGERIAGNPVSLATPSSGPSATVSPEPESSSIWCMAPAAPAPAALRRLLFLLLSRLSKVPKHRNHNQHNCVSDKHIGGPTPRSHWNCLLRGIVIYPLGTARSSPAFSAVSRSPDWG